MNKRSTLYLVQGAVIAAMYVAVFYAQELLLPGSATLAVQFRISEALTILAAITPAAIPGLTVGCLIANLLNVGTLPLDIILGTLATLLAAMCAYWLRNIKFFKLPILSSLMPALFNGVIIGLEITLFLSNSNLTFAGFLSTAGLIALGELAVCIVLGLPLYNILKRNKYLII